MSSLHTDPVKPDVGWLWHKDRNHFLNEKGEWLAEEAA
jgi:hypothetical protein